MAAGILLIALSGLMSSKPKEASQGEKPASVDAQTSPDAAALEKRLCTVVEKIKGVSDVSAFITYENSGVKKAGTNSSSNVSASDGSSSAASEDTAVMKKSSASEEPFVSEEVMPQVRGVLIVARGAESGLISARITDAVSAVLGVPVHRVRVLPAG